MTGVQKIENAHLKVTDLESSLDFYTEAMGLVELDRSDGTVYLGCGGDDFFDLAVSEGGTGVEYFTIRVDDQSELDGFADILRDENVDVEEGSVLGPGDAPAIRCSLPSGITMQLAVFDKPRYIHSADRPHDNNFGPVDIDHITLATHKIKDDVAFLEDTLGWNISDVFQAGEDIWVMAFARYGDHHHDVGFFASEDSDNTLHHLAWTCKSFDHMKEFADTLSNNGHRLEMGLSRHYAGDNLFAYLRTPGGNRFELTAEVARLDDATATEYHDVESGTSEIISAWGGITSPDSLDECS